jgi:hypothetical protein
MVNVDAAIVVILVRLRVQRLAGQQRTGSSGSEGLQEFSPGRFEIAFPLGGRHSCVSLSRACPSIQT